MFKQICYQNIFFFFLISIFTIASLGLNIGNIIPNYPLPLTIEIDGTVINSKVVLDSAWHWVHATSNSQKGCRQVCNTPETCWSECTIEGVSQDQWPNTYGIHANGDALTIGYVTKNNVGSRMYLVQPDSQKYIGFNMLGREISFEADMSKAGCGLNGAVYFIEMPLDGGPNLKSGSPPSVGLGYCDAQCPSANFIQGKASGVPGYYPMGACCAEFDIWEANNQATQMTTHVCNNPGVFVCYDDYNCGRNGNRYNGQCDMDGRGVNPYKWDKNLYGTGSNFQIDTRRPFTIKTQFITDNGLDTGNLIQIRRIYVQDGKSVNGGSITEATSSLTIQKTYGGLRQMGEAFKRKMVLSFSLWDDYGSHMQWLDGGDNGPCPSDSGDPNKMRKQVPDSKVIYSKVKVSKLNQGQKIEMIEK